MDQIIVTETAVRTLVKELLMNDVPAVVNEPPVHDPYVPIEPRPEIDTSYRAYDDMYAIPVGTDISPKDKHELEAAIKVFLEDLPDVAVGRAFTKIEKAIEDAAEESGATEELSMKTADNLNLSKVRHVETESIRKAVRTLLKEIGDSDDDDDIMKKLDLPTPAAVRRAAIEDPALPPKFKPRPKKTAEENAEDLRRLFSKIRLPKGSGDYQRKREMNLADQKDPDALTYPELLKKKAEFKRLAATASPEERARLERELASLKTREMSYKEMAPHLGYAGETGAKKIDWLTLQKGKFLGNLSPEAEHALFGKARRGYIEFLKRSGELSDDEVKMLEDHPQAVQELDGFRDWLAPYVRDAQDAAESGRKNTDKHATKQWNQALKLVRTAHMSAAHRFHDEEEAEEEAADDAEDAEDDLKS